MVIIFVWLFLELSLFILAMLSGVWNFSALMKSTGLGTFGYSVFSRGNIRHGWEHGIKSHRTAAAGQTTPGAATHTRFPFPPG